MQVGVCIQSGQRLLHGLAHAHLVDVAHVEHLQALLMHKALFACVHAADADLPDLRRVQRCATARHAGQPGQRLGAEPAQAGHGHAMHIAAGRECTGVEVGMGIQPQHPQLLTHFCAMAGHGADAAQAQAVVATQQDGQVAQLQFGIHGVKHPLVPLHHLGQVSITVHGRLPGVGGATQVAPVKHLQSVRLQRCLQARHAQGLGPHGGAARPGADVGGGADQAGGLGAAQGVGWHGAGAFWEGSRCRYGRVYAPRGNSRGFGRQ